MRSDDGLLGEGRSREARESEETCPRFCRLATRSAPVTDKISAIDHHSIASNAQ